MGLSLDDLAVYLAERYPGLDWSDAEISRHVNVSRESIKKYRTDGVPLFVADEIAVGLGVHPCRVWRRWWAA
jgi:hypothetical protein